MMLRLPRTFHAEAVPVSAALAGGIGAGGRGFRLVLPSGRLASIATGRRVSRQFTAVLLLDDDWDLDVEAVAATTALRFPTIGRIDARPPASKETAGAISIDGAIISLQKLPGRVPPERFAAPLKFFRAWDPQPAIRSHVGAVEITCGGDLPGLDGAKSYAAAVHFVATAACRVAPVSAVLWRESRAVSEPDAFAERAERILSGRMPLGAWISFESTVPKGLAPGEATGMTTHGMSPFIGRELELAPRPGGPRDAYRCMSRIARMVLDRGIALEEGQHLADPKGQFEVTVRERTMWLRRGPSAYVLVAGDSMVDVETLKPRTEVA